MLAQHVKRDSADLVPNDRQIIVNDHIDARDVHASRNSNRRDKHLWHKRDLSSTDCRLYWTSFQRAVSPVDLGCVGLRWVTPSLSGIVTVSITVGKADEAPDLATISANLADLLGGMRFDT